MAGSSQKCEMRKRPFVALEHQDCFQCVCVTVKNVCCYFSAERVGFSGISTPSEFSVFRDFFRTFSKDGQTVVIDDVSMQYLKGSTIDFTDQMISSHFEVVNNPNSESGCGCGTSFTPKDA